MQVATHLVAYWGTCAPAASLARCFESEAGLVRLIQSNAGSKCRDEEFAQAQTIAVDNPGNGV